MRLFNSRSGVVRRQHGFTMVELMIALLIGLFLMGGLVGLVQSNKRAFTSQYQLAQLQDSERLALTMMNDVIQQAGYFPDPTTYGLSSFGSYTGSGVTLPAQQTLVGTYSATAPGDSITVRYMTASGDGVLNCVGGMNTSGAPTPTTYVNTFKVVANQLVCLREDGNTYTLVNNVTNLSILYGVISSTSTHSNTVDTYMTASQVAAASLWSNVISVQVTLTFTNPLYNASYPNGQPTTLTIVRNITIMNQVV